MSDMQKAQTSDQQHSVPLALPVLNRSRFRRVPRLARPTVHSSRPVFLIFAVLAALLFMPASASAAYYTWIATTGDWSDASNWGGTEPTSSDYAYINNGGTVTITQTGEKCLELYLGNNAADSGTIQITNGSLSVGYFEYIGYSGTGTFTQTGGVNTLSSTLNLGYDTGSTGIYNLIGKGELSTVAEYIGYSGNGTFTQTGGTNSIYHNLNIGYYFGSKGTYNLNDVGKLTARNEYLGYFGTGSFNQTGGINSISDSLYLSMDSGANSTYILSGTGQLSTSYSEYIGDSGTGAFTQTGGTNSTSSLYLGNYINSTGTYNLNGSGRLTADNEYIRYSGTGYFIQLGGLNVATSIKIGTKGTYTLSGGTLNINGGFNNYGVWDLSNSTAVVIFIFP